MGIFDFLKKKEHKKSKYTIMKKGTSDIRAIPNYTKKSGKNPRITSLDFRNLIGRKKLECSNCHSKFFAEIREGNNKFPAMCPSCMITGCYCTMWEQAHTKNSNIPAQFARDAIMNADKHSVNCDDLK